MTNKFETLLNGVMVTIEYDFKDEYSVYGIKVVNVISYDPTGITLYTHKKVDRLARRHHVKVISAHKEMDHK